MDVACYGGQVYVTTDFRILKLKDDKLVNDTDFAEAKGQADFISVFVEVAGRCGLAGSERDLRA